MRTKIDMKKIQETMQELDISKMGYNVNNILVSGNDVSPT